MKQYVLTEIEDGKELEVVRTSNLIAMWYDGEHKHVRPEGALPLNEKEWIIQQPYKDTVYALKEMYPEVLSHIPAELIKFIVDKEWEPTDKATKNSKWKVKTAKETSPIKLMTGFRYVIKLRTYWLEKWNNSQINACILGQLLRIDSESFEVINYEEGVHSKLAALLGDDYLEENKFVKDPLANKLDLADFKVKKTPNAQTSIHDFEKVDNAQEELEESNIVDVEFAQVD